MSNKLLIILNLVIISLNIYSTEVYPHKVALITGVSRGIGYALAQNLLNRGIHVIGIARSDASTMQKLLTYPHFTYIAVDLATSEGIEIIKKHIETNQYVFDCVIHNAGIMMPPQTIETMNLETMEKVIQINLLAPMKLSKIIISHCNTKARILNINSRAATTPIAQVAPYCIAKAGLTMFTDILRQELKNRTIAVASVIPGEVDTEIQQILRNSPEFMLQEKFHENYIDGKLITPDMCAKFLSWLLCDTSFDEFNNVHAQWDIYDQSHHENWLQGDLPTFPF